MITGMLREHVVVLETTDEARELYARSRYGTMLKGGVVQLSLYEACFLLGKEKISVDKISIDNLFKRGKRFDKQFAIKYSVFSDLREKGYVVKSALKFGADFRVYDKGVKPGETHAKWIVFAVHESQGKTWQDFSAKNRVAHSTRKKLLLGVVDSEEDVTYWEVAWVKP